MEGKRLLYLDSLRGLAILGVLLIHTRLYGAPVTGWLKDIIDNGDKGVQLFFVISALVLCLSVEKSGLKEFHRKRIRRIWPLFAVATVVYTIINKANWLQFLVTLFMLHGVSPTMINLVVPGGWYIGTLVILYLVFPWLWKIMRSAQAASIGFFVSVVVAFILNRVFDFLPYEFRYYYAIAQLPVFILGILAYFVMKDGQIPKSTWMIMGMLMIVDTWKKTLVPDYVWWGVGWAALIIVMQKKNIAWINNKVMRKLGEISYEMYLAHSAVYMGIVALGLSQLTGNIGLDAVLRYGMAIVGSAIVGAVIQRVSHKVGYECQALQKSLFRNRWIDKLLASRR